MITKQYEIEKYRNLRGGEIGAWNYSAYEKKSGTYLKPYDSTLEGLARELATYPRADVTIFNSKSRKNLASNIAFSDIPNIQTGTVSDDEIAELSLLYHKYTKK